MRKILVLLMLLIFVAPWLAPLDPYRSSGMAWQPPDGRFWFGTDGMGRDVLSRTLNGGRMMLLLPLVGTLLSSAFGVTMGLLLAGMPGRGRRGVVALDAVLIVPPLLVVFIVLYGVGADWRSLLIALLLLNVPFTARYIRSLADPLLDSGYVESAIAAGDGMLRVLYREVLPGLWSGILADAGIRLVSAMYLIASVSFLGVVVPGTHDGWAMMVREALPGIMLNPLAVVAPVLCIALTVVIFNHGVDRWQR